MTYSYLCITIPEELQKYKKAVRAQNDAKCIQNVVPDFGVKLIKNENGELDCAAYYSDSGELLKRIYYNGPAVSCIKHFRNNQLFIIEDYYDSKLKRKTTYDKNENESSTVNFEYNKSGQVISIRKYSKGNRYEVEYEYDELKRVNVRKIKINSEVVNEQFYRYDILDRIVEYTDTLQRIKVNKINPNNELLSYTITDKAGNSINITNKYLCSEYIGTQINLNGHETTVKDKSYLDNVLLKKPFTSEDDVDFAMQNMIKLPNSLITKRCSNSDICDTLISQQISDYKINFSPKRKYSAAVDLSNMIILKRIENKEPLPISIRKRLLIAS